MRAAATFEKRRVALFAPYFTLVLIGFIFGFVGWNFNATEEQRDLFRNTMKVISAGSVFIALVWISSPNARRNKAGGVKSATLLSIVWFLLGLMYAVIVNAILYDRYPSFITIPGVLLMTYLQMAMFLQFIALSTCKMPSLIQRIVIAYPASIIFSATLISMLLVIIFPLITFVPYCSPLIFLPLLLSVVGLYQTLHTPKTEEEWDYVQIQAPSSKAFLSTSKVERSYNLLKKTFSHQKKKKGSIRIVQITDPHIGTMMSVKRLRTICEQTLKVNPDLVLLTGDFYTVEAYERSQHVLLHALEPLKQLKGKLFACIGNHDQEHSARERTVEDLKAVGVKLLVGEQQILDLEVGQVQIIGLDFIRPSNRRKEHINEIMSKNCLPEESTCLRIVMLHDPGAFYLLPNQKNMVFSGHTHGGQFGLISLGIDLTLLSILGIPDQGYFTKDSNCLYVHRAHGCRSMLGTLMVRLGCPPEFSVLDVQLE